MNNNKKLIFIKTLHTLIWFFFVSIIFYVLYCGIVNKINVYTWISIGLVIFEGFILLIFRMYCPSTLIARKYSNSKKDNFDIYLPILIARYNKQIFTTLFLIGLITVLMRIL
ncbi:MAG: hypothetical protein MUP98_18890 [Candidatus Aminicenantes bacterium]|nr:hypothetical protein [Candidatus Aminicenantes bacterium]